MFDETLAHSANGGGKTETLQEHLQCVANRAARYAAPFGASEEARAAALLHDVGKYRQEFQEYIRGLRAGGTDTHHSVYGAAFAFERCWAPAAFTVAGHHAGLHDRHELQALVEDDAYDAHNRYPALLDLLQTDVGPLSEVTRPDFVSDALTAEFYTRMLFSCVVDADRLAAEEFGSGRPRATVRLRDVVHVMKDHLLKHIAAKPTDGAVNAIRGRILQNCLDAAPGSKGLYSLTVPTGGGKTLASMAFALAHAELHQLDRVIVVIPYLSIIEQTAALYKSVLDLREEGLIVEHHSAVRIGDGDEMAEFSDCAAENWDAPVIVTTSVQFIESLFASSPAKCRKLHNIARSVLVFDEIQTLPVHLLNPLLSVIRQLKDHYDVTFVFMTATRPSLRRRSRILDEGFEQGEIREIVPDVQSAFTALRRVRYERAGTLSRMAVAARLAGSRQALCIVNTRRDAYELWQETRRALPPEEHGGLFHLSSAMCAEHRFAVLGKNGQLAKGSVRGRLAGGRPCRLIATQVVEAGVDVDFPLVMRAMGPLDSVVQAAGRCNREGRLNGPGTVIIFDPEEPSLPRGLYSTATGLAQTMVQGLACDGLDTDPELFERYFAALFELVPTDRDRIQEDRTGWRFRTVAAKGRVILDAGEPVVVPYCHAAKLISRIRARRHSACVGLVTRGELRSLQRYMVNVRERDLAFLDEVGMVEPLVPGFELRVLKEGCYHACLGLLIEKRPLEDLVI